MDVFDFLTLIGGLALFLFGMNLMGSSLEKRAGHKLKTLLGSITSNPVKGFFLGVVVTAILQSSSVTTVMIVGFVNSGLMALEQTVSMIIGANVGAAVTNWILALSGVEGESLFLQLLKPSTFTPVLAFFGMFLYVFKKDQKKKDTGLMLISFAVLMFGMEMMSSAVSGLRDSPAFANAIQLFKNPILGVLVGIVITAVIQSSSASIGILQALSMTGCITFAAAIPIIVGQNIGTCISAILSSIGASKNAKRAAAIHLMYNLFAAIIILPVFYLINSLLDFSFMDSIILPVGIAIANTIYKLSAASLVFPFSKYLVPLSNKIVKDSDADDKIQLLDERLLATAPVAIDRCRTVAVTMADMSVTAMQQSFGLFKEFDNNVATFIRESENKVDYYEDKLGSYLVKLSRQNMSEADSNEASEILRMIGDFERISDHSVNVLESADEMHDKKLSFSDEAKSELSVMIAAVSEIMDLALLAFRENDMASAVMVEPLEQVVDSLKEKIRKRHIMRLQNNECTIEMGFILTDLLTNLERVSDHCSNIAGCILEMHLGNDMDVHEYLRKMKSGEAQEFNDYYDYFDLKYALPLSK